MNAAVILVTPVRVIAIDAPLGSDSFRHSGTHPTGGTNDYAKESYTVPALERSRCILDGAR